MKRTRRSATIQDVAKAAGVSVSTVSRVLNAKDDVAVETIEKVQQVIKNLGYASSLAARSMRSHRNNVIGLVIPNVSLAYCHEILRGVNRAIAEHQYELIIYTNGNTNNYGSADQEVRYVSLLNGSIADGVIVATPYARHFSNHAPLVIIDPNHEHPGVPSIIAANREGALEAMRYLTSLGHRRIGFITGRTDLISGQQRQQGYLDGLQEAGIAYDPVLVSEGDYTVERAYTCAQALLSLPKLPTAVFASNDASALSVYQVAQEKGIAIPQQLSVVGFDNIEDACNTTPPLTTVSQEIATLGYLATQMLIKQIRGEVLENKLCVLPTRLIIRNSCRSLN